MSTLQLVVSETRTNERWIISISSIILIVSVVLDVVNYASFEEYRAISYLLIFCAIIFTTSLSVLRLGKKPNPNLSCVCISSAIILTATICSFYFIYFAFVPDNSTGSAYDKILNLPPVIAAIWAAGIGWLVNYHVSQRNARTKNAFDLVMQTRTSAEYQKNMTLMHRHYPFGSKISDEDKPYYAKLAIKEHEEQLRKAKEKPNNAAGISEAELKLEKSQAFAAMKYILNYFEFMAVGITKRDLDETLLYETIGLTAVNIFERAKPFIDSIQADGQALAYSALTPLIRDWKMRILQEETNQKAKKFQTSG